MVLLSELLEDQSNASQQAKELGLTHIGWGKYADKNGKVTHVSKDGELVPIQSIGLRPRRVKGPVAAKPEPDEKPIGDDIVPIESVPTKQNPTYVHLSKAAAQHKYVIMANKPIKRINFTNLRPSQVGLKPHGLWYALGSAWVDFTARNMPKWKGDYLYRLEINPERILILDTAEKMKKFTQKYGKREYGILMIEWPRVQKDYDGIQIADENGEHLQYEPGFDWYYTWDVPSGCIWRASGIQQANQIPVE